MDQIIWKNKVVALWIFSILNFIAVLLLPGSIELIIEQMGDIVGLVISFYFSLTCLMIWLTVSLKPTQSRWPIILVGVFFSFVKIQWIISAISGELILDLFIAEIWGLIVTIMIIWYGWKIPEMQPSE
jgi:hypothetical protein